ncbi:DUF5996 family protein [Salinicoccus albus]|uniref:DUF5996 family protein n=1 Tax=Salinicoccus albus TaxID=418756 RepID=UPI0003772FCE|nr:DUF5996 family protein [Salinicoccus albus]
MGFYSEHKEEITTLQLIAQMLGKIKLEYAPQEPQWAHVILDITPRGFTTGLLEYDGACFEIEADLIKDQIIVKTEENDRMVKLAGGKPISQYYSELFSTIITSGFDISINTMPQEMESKTPFEDDTANHYYDSNAAKEILQWFQFAWNAEKQFIAPMRKRKVHPGLFWGTFDVSCILLYDKFEPFPNDNMVIERAAFDEHMIEFGFWLGDDKFEHPAFFALPYPFVEDHKLAVDDSFPRGSYFDSDMAEYLYKIKNDVKQNETGNVKQFFDASFRKSYDYLEWDDISHCMEPLKMEDQ